MDRITQMASAPHYKARCARLDLLTQGDPKKFFFASLRG